MNTPKAAPVAVEAAVQRLMAMADRYADSSAQVSLDKFVNHIDSNPARAAMLAQYTSLEDALRAELASPLVAPVGDASAMSNTKRKKLLSQMQKCGGRPTKKSSEDGPRLIVSAEDLERFLEAQSIAATRPQEVVRAEPDTEKIMQQWDYWRKQIAEGDKSSAPRDWFESVLEGIYTAPAGTVPLSQGNRDQSELKAGDKFTFNSVPMVTKVKDQGHLAVAESGSVQGVEPVPAGVLQAIVNAGFTLTKTQRGYELRKFGPAVASATPAQSVPAGGKLDSVHSGSGVCGGVTQWQPIETAPRGSGEDGPNMVTHPDYVAPPRLLLATEDGLEVGYYDWYYHAGYGMGAEPGVSAWRNSSSEPIYPTHWMPLPAPPTGEGA